LVFCTKKNLATLIRTQEILENFIAGSFLAQQLKDFGLARWEQSGRMSS
jgi:hypothetical protein